MIRTLRSFVNTKLGAVMDSNHDVITWIVRYASALIYIFHIGHDGHTSYFRRKGKNTHPILVPICEKILFKPLSKGNHNKLEARFNEGIFLGLDRKMVNMLLGLQTGFLGPVLLNVYLKMKGGTMNMYVVLRVPPGHHNPTVADQPA